MGNRTEQGFRAIKEQLKATSLMAFQTRIAVDMLLAENSGVCSLFGDQCCTIIPNNTAPDGSLTRAIEGLRTLNTKMKVHSGVKTAAWDPFGEMFGKYKALITSALMSLAVFSGILVTCGCCCVPCIRALCVRLMTTAIAPVKAEMYALLPVKDPDLPNDDDEEEEVCETTHGSADDDSLHVPDLFPDPGDYDGGL